MPHHIATLTDCHFVPNYTCIKVLIVFSIINNFKLFWIMYESTFCPTCLRVKQHYSILTAVIKWTLQHGVISGEMS